jgi:predicted dehydrogenase
MKKLRIGFIGCGPRAIGLMQTCAAFDSYQIVAVCDVYPHLAEQAARSMGKTEVSLFTDHRKMLREAEMDAVCIAVAPEYAAALAVESMEAGKHVLSEVPMTYSLEDCWNLVITAERTGMVYHLAEQTRYWPFIQKWKSLIEKGELGKIVYVEGEYLHGMEDTNYYQNPKTGERISIEEAQKRGDAKRSRMWSLNHPILYLPHELSPLLHAIDDRVTSVLCMSTPTPSLMHDFFPNPDFEIALMQTAKGRTLSLRAGFTVHTIQRSLTAHHWYRIIGTGGTVETHRSSADKMKWLRDVKSGVPEEVWWGDWDENVAGKVRKAGHGGADYYPFQIFADYLLHGRPPDMDVYLAAECAAPAIIAARSAEQNSIKLNVPDFRPGPQRQKGQYPDDF